MNKSIYVNSITILDYPYIEGDMNIKTTKEEYKHNPKQTIQNYDTMNHALSNTEYGK